MFKLPNFAEKELIALENIIDSALRGQGIKALQDVLLIIEKIKNVEEIKEEGNKSEL